MGFWKQVSDHWRKGIQGTQDEPRSCLVPAFRLQRTLSVRHSCVCWGYQAQIHGCNNPCWQLNPDTSPPPAISPGHNLNSLAASTIFNGSAIYPTERRPVL